MRLASGTSNALTAAVASAGWRSLDAGAIVRAVSSNTISAVWSVSDLTTPTPYCGWRTFIPIWSVSMFIILGSLRDHHESATILTFLLFTADFLHIAAGSCRCLFGTTAVLARIQISRVPVPPIVLGVCLLVIAMMLFCLVQELGKSCDILRNRW